MPRSITYSALVLRNRPSGESNSEVTLLTAEEGIVRATMFGGPKSKLRSHSAPYNSGKVWIYRDPAKDYCKLSDFDVKSWRPGLRELYERTMAAGAVAQTILFSHGGGGNWDAALKLAASTLDALEGAGEELCSRLLIHFLWRWADFLGIQPRLECAACDGSAENSPRIHQDARILKDALWFDTRENSALCENCAHGGGLLRIDPGCRRWLAAVGELEPSHLYRYSMDNRSFAEAKALVTAVMTAAIGKRLSCWEW